jgi:hypothetical protein
MLRLADFHLLSRADQLGAVLADGTHLVTRYQEAQICSLYSLGTFFVEVSYDLLRHHVQQCRGFTSTASLVDDYPIELPHTELE